MRTKKAILDIALDFLENERCSFERQNRGLVGIFRSNSDFRRGTLASNEMHTFPAQIAHKIEHRVPKP